MNDAIQSLLEASLEDLNDALKLLEAVDVNLQIPYIQDSKVQVWVRRKYFACLNLSDEEFWDIDFVEVLECEPYEQKLQIITALLRLIFNSGRDSTQKMIEPHLFSQDFLFGVVDKNDADVCFRVTLFYEGGEPDRLLVGWKLEDKSVTFEHSESYPEDGYGGSNDLLYLKGSAEVLRKYLEILCELGKATNDESPYDDFESYRISPECSRKKYVA